MASHAVTLNLPDILYERVRQRAELLEVVVNGVPLEDCQQYQDFSFVTTRQAVTIFSSQSPGLETSRVFA